MQPGETACQRQPEPSARLGTPDSRVDLLELVKDPLLVLLVDTDAGIGERNGDCLGEPVRLDRDHAALGCELYRVRAELHQHLPTFAALALIVPPSPAG